LMINDGDRLQMTYAGKRHFGGVVASFYSPAVKEYIVGLKGGENFDEDVVRALERNNPAAVSRSDPSQQPISVPSFPSQHQTPLQAATNLATCSSVAPATKSVLSA